MAPALCADCQHAESVHVPACRGQGCPCAAFVAAWPLLRCIECDSLTTGIEDRNHDGFALCAACRRIKAIAWGADPSIPRVGHKTKTWIAHCEATRRMLTGNAINKLQREGVFYDGQRYLWQVAEGRLLVDARVSDAAPVLVKAPDLFGAVHATHATEGELNGFKPAQLPMFGAHEIATKPKPVDANQGRLI